MYWVQVAAIVFHGALDLIEFGAAVGVGDQFERCVDAGQRLQLVLVDVFPVLFGIADDEVLHVHPRHQQVGLGPAHGGGLACKGAVLRKGVVGRIEGVDREAAEAAKQQENDSKPAKHPRRHPDVVDEGEQRRRPPGRGCDPAAGPGPG